MHRTAFTLEIHPRAWYALANLSKEAYERIKRALAGVAESAGHAQLAGTTGGLLALDGYLARYEVQPERRCVKVLSVERSARGEPAGRNVVVGASAAATAPLAAGRPADGPTEPAAPAATPGTAKPGDR